MSKRTKECQVCGEEFAKPPKYSQKQWKKAKYCSNECDGISKREGKHIECGHCEKEVYVPPSWNTKYCSSSCFMKDRPKEEHPRWKENGVGMAALHEWVKKEMGKPDKCEHCNRDDAARYEWANKSGEYKRDTGDWIRLCSSCHKAYDGMTKLTKEQAERIQERYKSGNESQADIAKDYPITQSAVSKIVNNQVKYYV